LALVTEYFVGIYGPLDEGVFSSNGKSDHECYWHDKGVVRILRGWVQGGMPT